MRVDFNVSNVDKRYMSLAGMDPEAIRRYAAARKRIDESADMICCISSVFSVFEDWGDDRVAISSFALGKLNDLVNRHACRILEALEDFATANEAKDFVEKLEEGGGRAED